MSASTLGDIESVLFVGPSAPATNRGLFLVEYFLHALFANSAFVINCCIASIFSISLAAVDPGLPLAHCLHPSLRFLHFLFAFACAFRSSSNFFFCALGKLRIVVYFMYIIHFRLLHAIINVLEYYNVLFILSQNEFIIIRFDKSILLLNPRILQM